jgi:serine/threonine protein kinase
MGRRCAVKVMNPMLLYDPDSVSRFNREAANASQINHPNVAAIYDFGESDDLVYLAMELVEGESLAALLSREGALPELRAISIVMQVADALNAAHDFGIVHRDLKPDNIMITRSRTGEDVVKVVDFGIAKATRGGNQKVTRTGFVVGTPAYMSPEQILGETLDGRSDLYSLGCILYEMLTGERAFADASGEISIRQRLTAPPPRPSRVRQDLSPRLDAIVTTAMARAPEKRMQTALQFREALNEAVLASPASRWLDWLPWRRSKVTREKRIPTGGVGPVSRPGGVSSPPIAARPVASATAPGRTPPAASVPESAPPSVVQDKQTTEPAKTVGATTIFRHRSARPTGAPVAWIAAALIGVAVAGFAGWALFGSRSRGAAVGSEADTKIALPNATPLTPSSPVSTEATGTVTPPQAPPAPPETPATGTVRFAEALPAGATVTVDGAQIDVGAGGTFPLPPGRHLVKVEAPGFRPMTQSTTIAAGQTEVVRGRLLRAEAAPAPVERPAPPPAPTTGTIVVTGAIPPGSQIAVDGTPVASDLREISVSPGAHWIAISAAGFRPDSARVEVKAGGKAAWDVPALVAVPKQLVVDISTPDTAIAVGSTARLHATVTDESGAVQTKPILWESTNPAVVRVEQNGRVVGAAAGRAYVRARSENQVDSTLVAVLRVAKPAPEPAPPPEEPESPAAPAAPTAASLQNAAVACAAALGSKDEQQIVGVYQAKTALDVTNLRKLLDVALRAEAQLEAAALKMGTPSADKPGSVDALIRFSWRNNAGVNKKKEAPFRVELKPEGATWKLAACRATEKLGF